MLCKNIIEDGPLKHVNEKRLIDTVEEVTGYDLDWFLDHGCMIQEHWIMASLSGKK